MLILYTTPTGKTTATTCLPVDERFKKSHFKNQLLAYTDWVEPLEYVLIGLVVLDIILGFVRQYGQRVSAVQQLAALEANQNQTPPIQRRNSNALLRVTQA